MKVTRLATPADEEDCSSAWEASGACGLSGRPGEMPLPVPIALVRELTSCTAELRSSTAAAGLDVNVDGLALLGERAALNGLSRNGPVSCGGGTRLLQTADGWIALSLARESDRECVPAWLERPCAPADETEVWEFVASAVRSRTTNDLVDRAALLGMPCSRHSETLDNRQSLVTQLDAAAAPRVPSDVLVVDLSSMWAGPLVANLLGVAGARVLKVESNRRPDGTRLGDPTFFDLLHAGHDSVVLDFDSMLGRAALSRLVSIADVVIEASRPRAFQHLGIAFPHAGRTKVWLSITGHGRDEAHGNRVAFGDDAAVAGGLVTSDSRGLCFCADAVADPATGLVGAALVAKLLSYSGRWHVDLAMSRVAASLSGGPVVSVSGEGAPPRHRPITGRASAFGADTESVLREFRC